MKQAGYESAKAKEEQPMLDFLFGVTHPSHWHDLNMIDHRDHYSFLARLLGSTIVSYIGEEIGAGFWFNVECLVKGRIIKYGIISIDALCRDLNDWQSLYAAGRLHKPVKILRDEARVRIACQVNLRSALRTSLLLLPRNFHKRDLYETITSLSYRGDVRMKYAENPKKIKNIVEGQYDLFDKLYSPFINRFEGSLLSVAQNGNIEQSQNPKEKGLTVRKLPPGLKNRIRRRYGSLVLDKDAQQLIEEAVEADRQGIETEISSQENESREDGFADHNREAHGLKRETEILNRLQRKRETLLEQALWTTIAQQHDFDASIVSGLQDIVSKPASRQSFKGIISVGPSKGVRYVWPKVKKRFGII